MNRVQKWFVIIGMVFSAITLIGCQGGADGESEALYISAVEKYAQDELREARELLEAVLKKDRNFFQAELLLGKIDFFEDKTVRALAVFSRLARKMPQYTEARLWKIRSLMILERYDEAEDALDMELAVNPGDWRVHYQYALLSAMTGNMEKRLVMLRNAETYLGESYRVYLEYAKIWYSLKMQDRAEHYLKRAALIAPEGVMGKSVTEIEERIAGQGR
ncbi:MAG: hypothetical protein LBQ88_15115 [Treponema sp.]|jgi:tetratricopeptide (TPR) repeat protein|nr:hypothetical protein [Treponema sp.]